MRSAGVATLCAAVVLAFAAITISVVQEREGLTTEVTASFGQSLRGSGLVADDARITCHKQSVDFYLCRVISPGPGADEPPRTRTYRLGLRDDGCWMVLRGPPVRARRPGEGCIGRRQ